MSDVIKKELEQNLNKDIRLFLKNKFHYLGKLLSYDTVFIKLLDYKTNSYKILRIEDVSNIQIPIVNGGNNRGNGI